MTDKTITLSLGGKERTLLYGTMGYFMYIKEATKQEPFEWLQEFDKKRQQAEGGNITVLIEDIAVLIYAGINSHLDSLDQQNVPLEKVKKWCNGVTVETATSILLTAFGTIQTDEPGELTAQPGQQNGEVKVNA